jgi:glycosyltransferase involved in cell wall biosynthesis
MKVLFVCDAIDPSLGGGTAERTYRLGRAMKEAGAEVSLLATRLGLGAQRLRQLAGIDCTLVPTPSRRFIVPFVSPARVARCVRQADVVHIHGHWSWLGALSGWMARRHGRPYVYCPAGSLSIFGRSKRIKQLYNAIVGKRLVRGASCCVAVTEQERAHFHAYGVPDSHIVVLPNGVDAEPFDDLQPQRARDRHAIGAAPLVLFLGRLALIKGPDLLIEAWARIAASHPDARLLLAGRDAGERAALLAQIDRLGLQGRVQLIGNVEGQDKLDLLAAADLLVVPSRQEAMSLVVLEAGLLGTPALITDQCGFDALEPAGGGHIVPATADGLAVGLQRLLNLPPAQRQAMGAALQRLVLERYTWAHLARQAWTLHRQLIDAAAIPATPATPAPSTTDHPDPHVQR